MELKEAGNVLFREGDFRGAADVFQRAVEAVQQVRSKRSTDSLRIQARSPSCASDLRMKDRHFATPVSGKDSHLLLPPCSFP